MHEMSEYEQRILSELEEAWNDNVFAMLNTIVDPQGADEEVSIIGDALNGLLERGFVSISLEKFYPRDHNVLEPTSARQLLNKLGDVFVFNSDGRHWTLRNGDMKADPYPAIILTELGRSMAVEILGIRGYRWWRPK